MVTHRIKELREARGWSQEYLGSKINRTKHAVSRLEKGDSSLDLQIAQQIADAFGVPLTEVLVLDGKNNTGGFSDEGRIHVPAIDDPLHAHLKSQRYLLEVDTNALDQAGLSIGDIVIVDETANSCRHVAPLQIVVVNYRPAPGRKSIQLLRQFIPPNLLITNSSQKNLPSLNLLSDNVVIIGVVIEITRRFKQINA